MRNSPSWIALYMGVLMAGGIACLLNGWWQAEELAEAIADVDCGLVFADPPRAARIADAGLPTTVIAIDDRPRLAEALAPVTNRAAGEAPPPALTGEANATTLFSPGSTDRKTVGQGKRASKRVN